MVALGAGALAFDLSQPSRLPSGADWAEAAGALRAKAQPGDAVQMWPAWAERGRLVVDALPVFTEEDLAAADYLGVSRLWLLALPGAPRGHLDRAQAALRSRGAAPAADELHFGALSLQPWDLRATPVVADLTGAGKPEFHEVAYVAHRCRELAPGGQLALPDPREAGAVLHLRAGFVGERPFDVTLPPATVKARADGAEVASLEVKSVLEGERAWQGVDVPLPPGSPQRRFNFTASAPRPDRHLCVAAWTSK